MGKTRLAHCLSLLLATFVLVAAFSFPDVASAQKHTRADEKRAREHFEEGRLAFTEGRYDDALLHFRESYTLSHKPQLLFNIGNVLDRLRHDEEAISQYEQYLSEVPAAENREQVESRLAVLRRSVEERQQAQATLVPTPQEVAAADVTPAVSGPVAPVAPVSQSETRPLYKKWWVWTAVGSAVVAAVVIGVVASSGSTEKEQGPLVVDGMTRKVEL